MSKYFVSYFLFLFLLCITITISQRFEGNKGIYRLILKKNSQSNFFGLSVSWDEERTIKEKYGLNLGLSYTWMPDSVYQNNFKGSFHIIEEGSLEIKNITYNYTVASVTLTILQEEILIPDYYINILDINSTKYYDTGIGLAYKFDNEKYSLIHSLFNKGEIKSKLFAIRPHNSSYFEFFIGGITNEGASLVNENDLILRFSVNEKNNYWGNILNKIIYDGKTYETNNYVYFNPIRHEGILSNDFFLFMTNTLKEQIQSGKCQVVQLSELVSQVKCIQNGIIELEEIEVYFDNKAYKLNMSSFLFDCSPNSMECNSIFYSDKENNSTDIILGYEFLSKYNLSIFNYDSKTVSIYRHAYKHEEEKTEEEEEKEIDPKKEEKRNENVKDIKKYKKYCVYFILANILFCAFLAWILATKAKNTNLESSNFSQNLEEMILEMELGSK